MNSRNAQSLVAVCVSFILGATAAHSSTVGLDGNGVSHSVQFSAVIRETAAAQKITYLPLNELMAGYLQRHGAAPALDYTNHQYVMYKDIFKHYVLGKSYNEIARANGFLLVTDFLHLNCTAAGMTADLIQGFVEGTRAP